MTRWHTYAVEWTPTQITGYVDGVRFFRDSNRGHLPRGPMHASMQLDWFPRKKSGREVNDECRLDPGYRAS